MVPPDPEAPSQGFSGTFATVIGTVVIGILCITLITLAVCLTNVRQKRSLHGTYNPQKQEIYNTRFEMKELPTMKLPPEERLI